MNIKKTFQTGLVSNIRDPDIQIIIFLVDGRAAIKADFTPGYPSTKNYHIEPWGRCGDLGRQ